MGVHGLQRAAKRNEAAVPLRSLVTPTRDTVLVDGHGLLHAAWEACLHLHVSSTKLSGERASSNSSPVSGVDVNARANETLLSDDVFALMRRVMRQFIRRLRDDMCNVRVFADGPRVGNKTEHVLLRRKGQIETLVDYANLHSVDQVMGRATSRIMPVRFSRLLESAMRAEQCELVHCEGEADFDLGAVASSSPHVLGVMAEDTDFLVYHDVTYIPFSGMCVVASDDCASQPTTPYLQWLAADCAAEHLQRAATGDGTRVGPCVTVLRPQHAAQVLDLPSQHALGLYAALKGNDYTTALLQHAEFAKSRDEGGLGIQVGPLSLPLSEEVCELVRHASTSAAGVQVLASFLDRCELLRERVLYSCFVYAHREAEARRGARAQCATADAVERVLRGDYSGIYVRNDDEIEQPESGESDVHFMPILYEEIEEVASSRIGAPLFELRAAARGVQEVIVFERDKYQMEKRTVTVSRVALELFGAISSPEHETYNLDALQSPACLVLSHAVHEFPFVAMRPLFEQSTMLTPLRRFLCVALLVVLASSEKCSVELSAKDAAVVVLGTLVQSDMGEHVPPVRLNPRHVTLLSRVEFVCSELAKLCSHIPACDELVKCVDPSDVLSTRRFFTLAELLDREWTDGLEDMAGRKAKRGAMKSDDVWMCIIKNWKRLSTLLPQSATDSSTGAGDVLDMISLLRQCFDYQLLGEYRKARSDTDSATVRPRVMHHRNPLPIAKYKDSIVKAAQGPSRAMVIEGDTGCGKSTQVPQYLLDHCVIGKHRGSVIVTQPRRIAAITLASRVAEERHERVGDTVSYRIGGEAMRDQSQLLFVTVGWLMQKIVHAPHYLRHTSYVVFDEIHERSVDGDLLSMIVKSISSQHAFRHIRIVAMSATLEGQMYSTYFAGDGQEVSAPAPVLHVGVKRFPVTPYFIEDLAGHEIVRKTRCASLSPHTLGKHAAMFDSIARGEVRDAAYNQRLMVELCVDLCCAIAIHHRRDVNGCCVLVFLPGITTIEEMWEPLFQLEQDSDEYASMFDLRVLHSMVDIEDQRGVFSVLEPYKTRIVMSSNIAESSVTIPSVRYVINLGLVRQMAHDSSSDCDRLTTQWCSRASAHQRAGRAGRICPGTVFHLYSRRFAEAKMREYDVPEMQRVSLDRCLLKLKTLSSCAPPESILSSPLTALDSVIEPPSQNAIHSSVKALIRSGSLICDDVDTYEERADESHRDLHDFHNLSDDGPTGEKEDNDDEGVARGVSRMLTIFERSAVSAFGQLRECLPLDASAAKLIMLGLHCDKLLVPMVVIACASNSGSLFRTPYPYSSNLNGYIEEKLLAEANRSLMDGCFSSGLLHTLNVYCIFVQCTATGKSQSSTAVLKRLQLHPGRFRQFVGTVAQVAIRLQGQYPDKSALLSILDPDRRGRVGATELVELLQHSLKKNSAFLRFAIAYAWIWRTNALISVKSASKKWWTKETKRINDDREGDVTAACTGAIRTPVIASGAQNEGKGTSVLSTAFKCSIPESALVLQGSTSVDERVRELLWFVAPWITSIESVGTESEPAPAKRSAYAKSRLGMLRVGESEGEEDANTTVTQPPVNKNRTFLVHLDASTGASPSMHITLCGQAILPLSLFAAPAPFGLCLITAMRRHGGHVRAPLTSVSRDRCAEVEVVVTPPSMPKASLAGGGPTVRLSDGAQVSHYWIPNRPAAFAIATSMHQVVPTQKLGPTGHAMHIADNVTYLTEEDGLLLICLCALSSGPAKTSINAKSHVESVTATMPSGACVQTELQYRVKASGDFETYVESLRATLGAVSERHCSKAVTGNDTRPRTYSVLCHFDQLYAVVQRDGSMNSEDVQCARNHSHVHTIDDIAIRYERRSLWPKSARSVLRNVAVNRTSARVSLSDRSHHQKRADAIARDTSAQPPVAHQSSYCEAEDTVLNRNADDDGDTDDGVSGVADGANCTDGAGRISIRHRDAQCSAAAVSVGTTSECDASVQPAPFLCGSRIISNANLQTSKQVKWFWSHASLSQSQRERIIDGLLESLCIDALAVMCSMDSGVTELKWPILFKSQFKRIVGMERLRSHMKLVYGSWIQISGKASKNQIIRLVRKIPMDEIDQLAQRKHVLYPHWRDAQYSAWIVDVCRGATAPIAAGAPSRAAEQQVRGSRNIPTDEQEPSGDAGVSGVADGAGGTDGAGRISIRHRDAQCSAAAVSVGTTSECDASFLCGSRTISHANLKTKKQVKWFWLHVSLSQSQRERLVDGLSESLCIDALAVMCSMDSGVRELPWYVVFRSQLKHIVGMERLRSHMKLVYGSWIQISGGGNTSKKSKQRVRLVRKIPMDEIDQLAQRKHVLYPHWRDAQYSAWIVDVCRGATAPIAAGAPSRAAEQQVRGSRNILTDEQEPGGDAGVSGVADGAGGTDGAGRISIRHRDAQCSAAAVSVGKSQVRGSGGIFEDGEELGMTREESNDHCIGGEVSSAKPILLDLGDRASVEAIGACRQEMTSTGPVYSADLGEVLAMVLRALEPRVGEYVAVDELMNAILPLLPSRDIVTDRIGLFLSVLKLDEVNRHLLHYDQGTQTVKLKYSAYFSQDQVEKFRAWRHATMELSRLNDKRLRVEYLLTMANTRLMNLQLCTNEALTTMCRAQVARHHSCLKQIDFEIAQIKYSLSIIRTSLGTSGAGWL